MRELRQVVLLAAGTGSRLMPLTQEMPKCLVPVAGRPLIEHLLNALAPLEIDELLVVTGWQADRLRSYLGDRRGRLQIRYVHNAAFNAGNNIMSLHQAAPQVRAPFLLLESDLVFAPEGLSLLRPDCMLISPYRSEMRGTGVSLGRRDVVRQIVLGAHQLPAARRSKLWKTVNACALSPTSWHHFRQSIARRIRDGHTDDYYESALAPLVRTGVVSLRGVRLGGERWMEVDDAADLRAAVAITNSWSIDERSDRVRAASGA